MAERFHWYLSTEVLTEEVFTTDQRRTHLARKSMMNGVVFTTEILTVDTIAMDARSLVNLPTISITITLPNGLGVRAAVGRLVWRIM